MMQFGGGKMSVLSKVWRHFTVSDETGVCDICRKDIKLSKYHSTGNLWRHLKQDHPLEYENLRKGENNNCKSSTRSTKKYVETEEETKNSEKHMTSGYWCGKNNEMDIPYRGSTCEDEETYPKTKWLKYNQMDDCVPGVENICKGGETSTSRTNECDTDMSDRSTDEMESDEESDEDGNNSRVRLGNKTKSSEMTAEKGKRIEDMMKFVERVNGMSEKKRALGLKRVSNPSIKQFSEICLNILNGNVTIEPKFVDKIRCHKDIIRKMATKIIH